MYYNRRYGKHITVYYYSTQSGKVEQIPRKLTKHLDGRTDADIQAWMAEYAAQNGIKQLRSSQKSIFSDEYVLDLFNGYQQERQALFKPQKKHQDYELKLFRDYILVYFINIHREKDPRNWSKHTADLPLYLNTQTELASGTIKKILQVVDRFGRYLAARQIISYRWELNLRRQRGRERPRRSVLFHTPESILKVCQSLPDSHALAVLTAYFTGCRASEVYGLHLGDFVAGPEAKRVSKTYLRLQKYQLGSSLTVLIQRSKTGSSTDDLPKNHFAYGYVNIWHPDGAREIARRLADLDPDPNLAVFSGLRSTIDHRFRREAAPKLGTTLGQMRHAAATYLAKEVGLDIFLLKDQLRHASITTTNKYIQSGPDIAAGTRQVADFKLVQ